MFDQKRSRYSWRHYKSMIINFEDNSKYLWWQWSLNLWSKIYNVSLDQYTNKSFIWCVEKKNEFQFKIFNIPRLCACTFLLGSVHQVFHNISFYIHVYKHFITTPMWWKKISKQGWRSDLIIYPMLLIIPTLQAIWWNSRLTRWYDHVWDFHTPGYWFL